MNDELFSKRDERRLHLTLNRPQKANALSASLVEALLSNVESAYSDGTQLLVIDGAGNHFCAGFDFTDYESQSDGDLALRFIRIETLLQKIHHAPFETLVLTHGRVYGAGVDLISSCSIRIATSDTAFRMPGLQFGVVLGTRRLAHQIGSDRARDILGTSRSFDAEEALRIGFLTNMAPREEWPQLINTTIDRCELLAPLSAAALRKQTTTDTRVEDMMALVASVSSPGLKQRIQLFRTSNKRSEKRTTLLPPTK